MVPVKTEEDVEDKSSEFDICKLKFPRRDGFLPLKPLTNLFLSCAVIMPVRSMLKMQAFKMHQAGKVINIEGERGIREDVSDNSNGVGGDLVSEWEDHARV